MPGAARSSLGTKVPAGIALVILASLGLYGVMAVTAVREAVLSAAETRLAAVADQIASLLSTVYGNQVALVESVAADPSLADALRDTAEADTAQVLDVLGRLGPLGATVSAVELRDRAGRLVLALGGGRDRSALATAAPPAPGVTPLLAHGDTTSFEIVSPVVGGADSLGWVIRVGNIAVGAEAVALIARLIGGDAELLVGNPDGSTWSNLSGGQSAPAIESGGGLRVRDGSERVAAWTPIDGMPWLAAVELPTTNVLEPVRGLMWDFTWLGALILALATFAAIVLGRRLTDPIIDLSRAAARVATGDLSAEARATGRDDEIGVLARSFNIMAESVRLSHEQLEGKVRRRTADLEEALSELRLAQEELVRQERLATLGQLASSVGHELRNPLGVMANAVYYLEAVQTDPPAKVKEYLGILRKQVFVSEKIVSDLLDFARVKPPQRSHVTVPELVDEALARVSVPEGVRVEREVPSDLAPVDVDPMQISQILLNLLTNAVQAVEDQGGGLSIRGVADGAFVRIVVSDDGVGVPAANRDRIFEPLFTTKARGIGLGLSVSRSLARTNGGDLTLAPESGSGTTFVLDLPRAEGHA